MNSRLMHDLGHCIFIAQNLEFALSSLLMLERDKHKSFDEFDQDTAESLSELRANWPITRLYSDLIKLGVDSALLEGVLEVGERRNHLVHKLTHDKDFIFDSENFSLSADVELFSDTLVRVHSHLVKRAVQLGRYNAQAPISSIEKMGGLADRTLALIKTKRPGKKK